MLLPHLSLLRRLDSTGKTEISKRDLFDLCKGKKGMETVEDLEPGLNELARRGYIGIEQAMQKSQKSQKSRGRGRPPSPMIYVNPEYTKTKEKSNG